MKGKTLRLGMLCAAALVLCLGVYFANMEEAIPTGIAGQTSNAVEGGVAVPVPMYHHVLNEGNKLLGNYAVTPAELEKDLQWIQENGYTTVLPSELLSYVQNGTELPEKPIMLSFDDGYENFYAYVYPLLQKYQAKAVVSVIGYYSDLYSNTEDKHLNYSHLTWDELKEMQESGLVEVGNHTYNLHKSDGKRKGCTKLKSESEEAYRTMLLEDVNTLQSRAEEMLGGRPILFAYPFGSVSKQTPSIIAEAGFQVTLSCEEGSNYVREGDPECLLMMKRTNRVHNADTSAFYEKLTK